MVIYRVLQEEKSILWEVMLSVIVTKKNSLEDVSILNGYQDRTVLICLILKTKLLRFLFLGLDEE